MSTPASSGASPWSPPAAAAASAPPRESHWVKALPFIGPVVLFIIWDLAVRLGFIKAILLPMPADTIGTLLSGLAGGPLLTDFAVTVWRTLQAFLIAAIVGVPLGVLAAWRHGGWVDRALMGFSTLGFSIPVFVLGYLLIWLVSMKLGWLPVQGYRRLSTGVLPFVLHLILPSLTLSVVYIALIARLTRAAVSQALTEDFVRTARAKGLRERRVLVRHAVANAAVPIVTVVGIGLAMLMGGVVVTESVFSIPGLGRLTVDAVLARDFPVIQGVVLLFSVVYVLINLLVDLSYPFFDPRIRV